MEDCSAYVWCAYNNQTTTPFDSEGTSEAEGFSNAASSSVAEINEPFPDRNEREKEDGLLFAFEDSQKSYYNYLGSIYDNVLKIYNFR